MNSRKKTKKEIKTGKRDRGKSNRRRSSKKEESKHNKNIEERDISNGGMNEHLMTLDDNRYGHVLHVKDVHGVILFPFLNGFRARIKFWMEP